jgi:hypothetical protein
MSWKEVTRVTLSKKKDEQSPDDALSGPFFFTAKRRRFGDLGF